MLQLWNILHFEEKKTESMYHSVYKMWITQEPNTLQLWNTLHFEEKKRRVYTILYIECE